MSLLHCKVCEKDFLSENEHKNHFLSKQHLKKESNSKSVVVHNISELTIDNDTLLKIISQYGTVVTHKLLGRYKTKMLVEFKNEKTVKDILLDPPYIKDTRLNISLSMFHSSKAKYFNNLDFNYIKTEVNDQTSFDTQLQILLDKISLTDANIRMYYEPICKKLDEIFQSIFPKCKSYKFGSTVTSLGFKSCDLDIYLDIGAPIIEDNSIVGPNVVYSGTAFSIIEKTLHNHPCEFANVIPIPQASVPIIKFIYLPTNVYCDLSFKSNLGVHNSKLIKFYLSIDTRFRPLMMIIKYWFYNCDLKTKIGITMYALSILLIFYLQQVKLVPPVIYLKNMCAIPITMKGWQINFNQSLTHFQMNSEYKNKNVPELLEGFFEFYTSYDFKANVICPVDGCSYSKDLFYTAEMLPESMSRYKEYVENNKNSVVFSIWKPMCVQDPTELNNNITKNIMDIQLKKFQAHCSSAEIMVKKSKDTSYQDLFQHIFDFTNDLSIVNENFENDKTEMSFAIYPNPNILVKNLYFCNNWPSLIFVMVKQYLEQVLDFKVNVVENCEQSENHSENEKRILQCKGNSCLWVDRKNYKTINMNVTPLQNEIETTKKMLQKINFNDMSNQNMVDFECRIEKRTEPGASILLSLTNNNRSHKIFISLANHLMTQMQSVIKKTLNILQHR